MKHPRQHPDTAPASPVHHRTALVSRSALRGRSALLRTALALLLAGPVGLVGCSDDDDDPAEPDPVFPGETPTTATLEIDTTDLSGGAPLPSGPCHNATAFVAGVTNALVVLALATPVAALGVTVQNEPVYIGNQTWRWSGSGGSGQNAWSSRFDGRVANATTIEWTMQIDGTPLGLDDFVWYTGTSNYAAQNGSWTFYDPTHPNDDRELLRSTYAVESEDTASLVFENRIEGEEGFGDQLSYEADGDDLSMVFFDASANDFFTIEWDKGTGAGSTTNFEDEVCCWGPRPDYDDVQCP